VRGKVRDDSGTIEKVFEEPGLAGTDPTETIDLVIFDQFYFTTLFMYCCAYRVWCILTFIKQAEILREMIMAAVLYIQNAGASLRMKPVGMDAVIKCGPKKARLNQTCGCHNGVSHPRRVPWGV